MAPDAALFGVIREQSEVGSSGAWRCARAVHREIGNIQTAEHTQGAGGEPFGPGGTSTFQSSASVPPSIETRVSETWQTRQAVPCVSKPDLC